jgi:CheY-like chemotaxis protein
MKILIVDDETDLVTLLAEELTDLGHEVLEVRDVKSAELIWQGCDCALIDTMQGSFDFARKLKQNGVKTISFTGYNKIKSEDKDAFDGALTKPWEDFELAKLFK